MNIGQNFYREETYFGEECECSWFRACNPCKEKLRRQKEEEKNRKVCDEDEDGICSEFCPEHGR